MRVIVLALAGAVLAGCGTEERAAAPAPAADERAIHEAVIGMNEAVRAGRFDEVCDYFTVSYRRAIARETHARTCKAGLTLRRDQRWVRPPVSGMLLDVRLHGSRADVPIDPGELFAQPPVLRMVRAGDLWSVAGATRPPLTRIGNCVVGGASQYENGDWNPGWDMASDYTVIEFLERRCHIAEAQHQLWGDGGSTAVWARIDRKVLLEMCREGKITVRD